MRHRPVFQMPEPQGSSTSSSLLRRVQEQDDAAWQQLVQLYMPSVFRKCLASGLTHDQAGDVAQEVFKDVVRAIPKFERERTGQFRKWLATITKNRIIDHYRRAQRNPTGAGGTDALQMIQHIEAAAEFQESESIHEPDERIDRLYEALEEVRAKCEDRTWQAFWRIQMGGESPTDVARDMGVSLDNIYQIKSRILRRLRKKLDGPD